MRYIKYVPYLGFIAIPSLSSGLLFVAGTSLLVVGFTVSPILGRNSFHKAILFGRILYLTVIFGLSPKYSPRSAVYWGQFVPKGVGLLGFLKLHNGEVRNVQCNDGNAFVTFHYNPALNSNVSDNASVLIVLIHTIIPSNEITCLYRMCAI